MSGSDEIERLLDEHCARWGITREQFDKEETLSQEQIDALWVLAQAAEENPIVPEGLPGAGCRLLDLPDAVSEELGTLQMEFEELMPGTFLPDDDDEGEYKDEDEDDDL
jgi:hypothetical protein